MLLKVVLRNLKNHPFLNLVKVVGLSLALVGIVFIALFIKNEFSYDNYHLKAENIYRLSLTNPDFLGGKHFARIVTPGYLPAIKESFPEVQEFVRLRPVRGGLVKYNKRFYNVNQAFECDSTFFQVFNADMVLGDQKTILRQPASMVITDQFAARIFGEENPIGKTITLPTGQFYGNEQHFTVKGVMKTFPANSHFHPDFVATPINDKFTYGWAYTYLALNDNSSPENVGAGIKQFLAEAAQQNPEEFNTSVHLQKLSDIHLHSNKLREIENNGNMRNIYVLAIAAFILLIISISNYANLNIGMSGFSAKYLFISKIQGASKNSVVKYFFAEGLLIVLATLLLSFALAIPLNSAIEKFYGLNLLHSNLAFSFLMLVSFCFSSLIFGMLPALKSVFSNLSINKKVNTSVTVGRGGISRGLVIFQYAFSITLIVSVLVISRQTNYALQNGMGTENGSIVIFESVHASIQQKFEIFKQELLQHNTIESVSAMMEPPGGEANDMFEFELENYISDETGEQYERIGVFPCDYSFASIFNLNFLAGTNFSKANKDNEGSGEYIINEAALKRLKYSNPSKIVGKSFKLNFSIPESDISIPGGKIIGVVKDFHLSSMKKEVEPLVLFKRDNLWLINFVVAFRPGAQEQALADMNKVWTSLFPEYPFQYEHVGSMYKKVYKAELLQARLLSIFTLVALFICSMGLFGLALIITQNRIKEIGVRKVNGARVGEILMLLNRDFVKWVLLAFVLACPAAWFAMNLWLENFAYKTTLSWWIFALAGALALGIALLTVSWQSWRAATRNPIDSLRYE